MNASLQQYMSGGAAKPVVNPTLAKYAAANAPNLQDQKTINSFKSLDVPTRAAMLKTFQYKASKGDADSAAKLQLLTPHLKDSSQQAPNFGPQSLLDKAGSVANKIDTKLAPYAKTAITNAKNAGNLALTQVPVLNSFANKKQAVKTASKVAGEALSLPVGVASALNPHNTATDAQARAENNAKSKNVPLTAAKRFTTEGNVGLTLSAATPGVLKGAGKAVEGAAGLVKAAKTGDATKTTAKLGILHNLPPDEPKALPAKSSIPATQGNGFKLVDKADSNTQLRGTRRIQAIDSKLQAYHAGKSDLGPDDAKALMKQRNDLVAGRTQVRLDNIAGKHSAETGQPLAASHDAIKAGYSSYGDDYKAAQDEGVKLKASMPTKESVPKVNDQKPQKSLLENLIPKKVAGIINPQRAAGREGNLELARWANDHTNRINTRELDSAKAVSDYKQILKTNGVSHDDVIKSLEAGGKTGNPKVDQAAQFFAKHTKAVGQEGVANDTLKGYHENYVPRVGKFQTDTNRGTGEAYGLSRNTRFNNARQTVDTTDAHGNVTKTDKYATHADFKAAVEKNKGQVQSDTSKLLGHVLSTQGHAVENAKSVKALEDVTMRDGRPAILKPSAGAKATAGYQNVGGRLVHPEAEKLYSAITENGIKPNVVSGANSLGKRLVTINGLIHGKNFTNASIRNQGAIRTAGAVMRLMASPLSHGKGYEFEDVRRLVSHGLELSQTSASNLYDQFGKPNNHFGKAGEWLSGIRNATDKFLFETYGDHLAVTTALRVEKIALGKGLSADEAARVGAEAGKNTIFTIPKAEQSIAMRNTSRMVLFAGKYLQSTFKMGTNALGIGIDKTLSSDAQKVVQGQAVKALARGFGLTFAAAQAINYKTTGRFTWQNPDGAKKLEPVIYKDPGTGKEYYATNFYGQVGDLFKTFSDPVKEGLNKLAPGLAAGADIIANHDPYQQNNNGQIYDPNSSGVDKVVSILKYAAEKEIEPAGFSLSNTGGPKTPLTVQGFKAAGYSSSDAETRTPFQNTILTAYQKTLPAGSSNETKADQQKMSDEAQAHADLASGKTNTPALKAVQNELGPSAYKTFVKTGAEPTTQREFDKLSTATKVQIIAQAKPQDLKTLSYQTFADNLIYSLKHGSYDTTQGVSVAQAKQALAKVGYGPSSYTQALADYKAKESAAEKASKRAPKPASQL